jgi:hypothetical protein
MEEATRDQLIDELSSMLRRAERKVANKKSAIKACTNSRSVLTLVRDLRLAMAHKDALEGKLVRLRLPTPLFCLL